MTITASAASVDDQRHVLVCLIDRSSTVDGSASGKSATLLVFQNPQTYPVLERLAVGAKHIIRKLGGFLEFRRYPRNERYMSTLVAKCLPGVIPAELTFRDAASDLSTIDWNAIGQVVLLWPDANGTGWWSVERRVFSRKSAHTTVHVLNGRGRYFELTPGTWMAFVGRRFVEKSFLPETVFLLIFLITSPFLAFADFCTQRER